MYSEREVSTTRPASPPMRRPLLLLVLLLAALASPLALARQAGAKPPVELRFSVWDGDIALQTIKGLIAAFERENPGIRVKLENYPDYATYHQKMVITYAAGVAPDVAMEDPANFQRLAKRKAFLPLNRFYETTPGFDIGGYYRPIVDALSYEGTSYVLPRDIAPESLIYYNKKAFADAGLGDPKTYDTEWTWDAKPHPERGRLDWLTVCDRLMVKDKKGKTKRWAYASDWPELVAQTAAFSMGGNLVDDPEDPKKVLTRGEPMVAGYEFAYDLVSKWGYMPSSTDTSSVLQATTQQLFAQQKLAMYMCGIWKVPDMRKTVVPGTKEFFDWDICLFPAYANPGGKPVLRAPSGGSGYAIFSSTRHPDEAWRFTRYMAGAPGMIAMAKAGIAQPAIRALATKPGIWVPGPNTPEIQRYPANMIVTDRAVASAMYPMTWEDAGTVNDRLAKGLELVWSGQKPPRPIMLANAGLAQDRMNVLRREEDLPAFNWGLGVALGAVLIGGLVFWVAKPHLGRKAGFQARRETRSAYWFLSPWLIGLAVFTLGPMILSLLMAFANWDIIEPARYRGLGNFREAFTEDPSFWTSMWVTLKYTVVSVPLGIAGALGLALLLNQKVRGVAVYRSLYYIPSIASAVAASLIWRRIFNPDAGLLNALVYGPDGKSWLGHLLSAWAGNPDKPVDWLGNPGTALPALIIMSVWGIGGGMVIFLAGLQGIPEHYYEAATLDGAGTLGKFRNVTLPLLTPTIFFTLITGLIGSLQVFTQAFVMTSGGPDDATRFFVYHLYMNAFGSARMGYASALGWILFAVVLVFTAIQIRGSKWVYYEAEAK